MGSKQAGKGKAAASAAAASSSSNSSEAAPTSSRVASHAGSWYEEKGDKLAKQLSGWLAAVPNTTFAGPVRAIISPHAGYSYSGPTAAHCYKQIDPKTTKRVFILGPSHHHYTKICELSAHALYGTPVGDIKLDTATISDLQTRHKALFAKMSESVDENEHSIEMQLPYLAHVMKGYPFVLVPILVGALSTAKEAEFGAVLAPYLDDPATVFIMSSDFCHWGSRFQFTPYEPIHGHRWQSIEALDRAGMAHIEAQDAAGFAAYQAATQNTICGRHPIAVYLHALKHCANKHAVKFLHYTQSSKVLAADESSVSYAAAAISLVPTTATATAAAPAATNAAAATAATASSSSSSTAPAAAVKK